MTPTKEATSTPIDVYRCGVAPLKSTKTANRLSTSAIGRSFDWQASAVLGFGSGNRRRQLGNTTHESYRAAIVTAVAD